MDDFFGHRWPPKRHPDGDYGENGDLGVTRGNSDHFVRRREFPLRGGQRSKFRLD
jgi:hypothetical protein